LRRAILLATGFLGLLTASTALAKQNCSEVQQKNGGAAYQKCRYDEEENLIRDQVAAYRALAEREKEAARASYGSQINEENFSWKDLDLNLQVEEADRKYRIEQLRSTKENAIELQVEQNTLTKIQRIRSLTQTVHSNKIRRLERLRDTELSDLDAAIATYELRLRQQEM
jgi:hypothetical protein